MTAYYIDTEDQAGPFIWAGPEQLADEIPLPTAFAYFLPRQSATAET